MLLDSIIITIIYTTSNSSKYYIFKEKFRAWLVGYDSLF